MYNRVRGTAMLKIRILLEKTVRTVEIKLQRTLKTIIYQKENQKCPNRESYSVKAHYVFYTSYIYW